MFAHLVICLTATIASVRTCVFLGLLLLYYEVTVIALRPHLACPWTPACCPPLLAEHSVLDYAGHRESLKGSGFQLF